ncbi:40S ribosomal protein S30 [Culex quinquefasciatus]|uniref:40S ribosomal protein S30 n=1 Tax=Culex quinquefasciatus TaxID=7176 RepID=B0XC92_CULQU|nr:40S ribosomal protein S30 [Culex quinquefasciatus]|eukprot:XP_001867264.1 40S ribosomal protein S30 [Culex quinquefasciatus]
MQMEVEPQETIQDVKVKLAGLESIEAQLVLSCEGALLAQDSIVSALGSPTRPDRAAVWCSLARAGKVKGQTPNVEKKKKRRVQHNCNFANVFQAFGRRRGPNVKLA